MIGIIDYEMGNIFSLRAALGRLDCQNKLVSQEADTEDCSALILPGVGAFGDAMKNLKRKGLEDVVLHWVKTGKPLLGICLGMQLLFAESEEHGCHKGLAILPGIIKKIPLGVKVPHMGWNQLKIVKNHYLFAGFSAGFVYFVHSYYADTKTENILASTFYGLELPAIVGRENVVGMQFHPEKSGSVGMQLLKNWVEQLEVVK
ncbi:MAG: imidazole glycerol-phosphate synthase subunit HisH [Clostridia bacterium]|jgi:glutamine amidotransferase|nr:imidazole glycerol-phosphate synthase subunit HisH [Clostridia bacterium]MDN5322065.1 imidazole glycerol-phosphate synthase subunit HisH [Clostridia bacterium]